MPSSSIVVKVQYGKTLKRFRVGIQSNKLAIDISMLREKIRGVFSIAAGVDFTLTYVDVDDDEITLSADDDLDDLVEQDLDPLYITVNCELNKKPSPNSGPVSNFGAAQTVKSSTLRPQSQTVNPTVPQTQNTQLQQLYQIYNTQTPLSAAKYYEFVQKVTADVIKQLCLNKVLYFNPGVSVQPTPIGFSNVNGQTLNTPQFQTVTPAVSAQILNTAQFQTVTPAISAQTLNTPQFQTVKPAVSAQTLNTPHSQINQFSNFGVAHTVNSSSLQSQTVKPAISAQTLNTPHSQINQLSNIGAAQTVNSLPLQSQTVNPAISAQTMNTPHSQNNQFSNFGAAQTVNSSLQSQIIKPAISAQTLNTPYPQFYQFSNFGVAQTMNSLPLQSQTVTPAGSQAQKTVLQQRPRQTYNTETAFSAAKFSEHVQKMNVGVINQQDLNPGFTFKAPANAQPTTHGSSNVDGKQSGKFQVNPKGRSKNSKKNQLKLQSELVRDVTVPNGTKMAPLTKVTKIWRMRNNGTIAWPHGSKLQWVSGHVLRNDLTIDVTIPTDGLPVNEKIDIAVDLVAPEVPGSYISCWKMVSPSGELFGKSVSVSFQVDASMKVVGETSTNVNLPPVMKNIEVVNQETDSGNKSVSGFDSVFNSKEVKSALETDLESARVEVSSNDQEQAPLNDLEKMGFKQLDLNKEILKENNYDLEKSIEDRGGVSEWDSMSEELQELGITDVEALKKNKEV